MINEKTEVERLASTINNILVIVSLCFVFILLDAAFGPWFYTDTTDGPDARSGMSLHMDYLTGCQYLGHSGGLTPRLDVTGDQVCMDIISRDRESHTK